ncbi:hypothetical protein ACVWZ8_004626 [Arthrobacter sp. UYCu723]
MVVASEYGRARMITDKRRKLIERFDGPGEFYDLQRDPEERDNLFDDPSVTDDQQLLSTELKRRFNDHTRPGASGWALPVSGAGQIQPTTRGLPDERSYAQLGPLSSDPPLASGRKWWETMPDS